MVICKNIFVVTTLGNKYILNLQDSHPLFFLKMCHGNSHRLMKVARGVIMDWAVFESCALYKFSL